MIVISLKRFLISLILIILSTFSLLAISLDLYTPFPLSENLEKQDILFWGIIITIFQCAAGFSNLYGYRSIISDLNKLINNKDLNHPHSEKILKQLGAIGQAIARLMKELNDLLLLRTDRISAQNKVIRLLCEDSPEAIFVSDTMGSILGASGSLLEKLKIRPSDLTSLSDILPELKLAEVLVFLEKNREEWKDTRGSGIVCTPVFDKRGNLNLCVWVMESAGILQRLNRHPANTATRNTFSSLKGFFTKKKSEKS